MQALDRSFKFDVFICHSSKDKPFIAALIEDLKKEQITYWVDAEQINYGDQITRKIEDGLKKSKYIIPCLSMNLNTSGWTRIEYGAILNSEFCGNSERIVIPIMLDNCKFDDIPFVLRDKKRVIFSDKTDFDEFINFLKKKNKTPYSSPFQNGVSSERAIDIQIPETFTSLSTGIEFVLIHAGEFMMGSPFYEQGKYENEYPAHKVIIKHSFYMGKYPVTQKQWEEIIGINSSNFQGEDLPVESISWNKVNEFIEKLNELEGTNKYRLPSEAEWEYACRAGTKTRYYFGVNESKLNENAWYEGNSEKQTHPVGQKKPNPWGLYDMMGNVWEWCQDIWHDNYNEAPSDGKAWVNGSSTRRVRRGGGWNSLNRCRSASRYDDDPDVRYNIVGFRLVRDI